MPTIGVQAMMLKDDIAAEGPFETLRRISAIGYHAVEVSQIPMTEDNVRELGRARDELGVDVAALSAALTASPGSANEALEDRFEKIVSDAHALGASMVRIGMLPYAAMGSLDGVKAFCDASNEMAKRLRERGIRLYYHNHHIDFAKYDGVCLLDILAERSPEVGFEIDVHWVQRGGLDPVATLEKYGERVAMVHLKDYRIGRIPDDVLAAVAAGDVSGFSSAFAGLVEFAEVGEGNLDFRAIIEASRRIGAEYLLVEQDERYGRTAAECLQISYDNLVALGYAELF